MRRLGMLAVLTAGLATACSPMVALPTATAPGGSATPAPSTLSMLSDPVRACRDPGSFETPLPSGVTEPMDLFNSSYSPSPGVPGGVLHVGVLRAPAVFDPFRAVDPRDTILMEATWSGLTTTTSDYKWDPDLAIRVPMLFNGMVEVNGVSGTAAGGRSGPMAVLWCLRPGTAWSDGVPLTCADFQYTATWIRDVASDLAPMYGPITSVDCPDPAVMVIRYASPFEAYISHGLVPLPRHALGGRSLAELRSGAAFSIAELTTLPTSGAFHVKRVDGSTFELARNEGYRGGHRGAPAYLDALTIRAYPSRQLLVDAYRTGSVALATDLAWTDIASLEAEGLHDSIAAAPGLAYDTLRFNLASPVAGDVAIREALAHVLDVHAVGDALGPAAEEQLVSTVVAPQAWFFLELGPWSPSMDQAHAALAAGGWAVLQGELVRSADGRPARLRLCSLDDERHRLAAGVVQRAAAGLGIEVLASFVEAAQLTAPYQAGRVLGSCVVAQGDYDIALMPLDSFLEPLDYRLRYGSKSVEPAGLNDGRVAIPAIDQALDRVAGSVDFTTVKTAMEGFQQALHDAIVELPIGVRKEVALVRSATSTGRGAMQNFFDSSPGGPVTWNAEDWFLRP